MIAVKFARGCLRAPGLFQNFSGQNFSGQNIPGQTGLFQLNPPSFPDMSATAARCANRLRSQLRADRLPLLWSLR